MSVGAQYIPIILEHPLAYNALFHILISTIRMGRVRYMETSWRGQSFPINSLAPGGFENIFQNVYFKLISWIDTLSNSCETALRSMPQNPSGDKSTLVQVMAWCRQAASHYLSQCCPRSLSPYGVTRPQWVNAPVWGESHFHQWIHHSMVR